MRDLFRAMLIAVLYPIITFVLPKFSRANLHFQYFYPRRHCNSSRDTLYCIIFNIQRFTAINWQAPPSNKEEKSEVTPQAKAISSFQKHGSKTRPRNPPPLHSTALWLQRANPNRRKPEVHPVNLPQRKPRQCPTVLRRLPGRQPQRHRPIPRHRIACEPARRCHPGKIHHHAVPGHARFPGGPVPHAPSAPRRREGAREG